MINPIAWRQARDQSVGAECKAVAEWGSSGSVHAHLAAAAKTRVAMQVPLVLGVAGVALF